MFTSSHVRGQTKALYAAMPVYSDALVMEVFNLGRDWTQTALQYMEAGTCVDSLLQEAWVVLGAEGPNRPSTAHSRDRDDPPWHQAKAYSQTLQLSGRTSSSQCPRSRQWRNTSTRRASQTRPGGPCRHDHVPLSRQLGHAHWGVHAGSLVHTSRNAR